MARSRRRWNDRAFASEHRTGLRILAFSALLGLVPALVLIASLPANGATPPSRSGRSLDVVGGPIVAGTDVVVVSVDRSQTLHLDGVNPVTDTVLWQRPYAASATTPAIALTPAATGTTVADIVPAANSATPSVTVDGVNPATGAIEWKLPESIHPLGQSVALRRRSGLLPPGLHRRRFGPTRRSSTPPPANRLPSSVDPAGPWGRTSTRAATRPRPWTSCRPAVPSHGANR